MWLVYRWREVEPPYRVRFRALDLDRCPCSTVGTFGVGPAGQGPDEWWLAERRPAGALMGGTPAIRADRPPYRIPTMAEIREVPWNGLNVVSTFAGCGGSSTGYRMAGYRVLAAVEFVPAAADAYQANKADYTTLLRRDVRGLEAAELLAAAGLEVGELDVLDGSPPCEPFSTAGRRERTWNSVREYSGQRQRTDDLFYEYARLVEGMRPRVFAAENVTGLARGRARGYFKRILARLRECGYRVQARTLDAAWLGVPQHRQRIIIVGVRDDLGLDPVYPAPLAYQYTVRDAIGDLLAGGEPRMGSFGRKHHPAAVGDEPAPTVVAGDSPYWHVDQVRVGHEFRKATSSLDEPAPTMAAKAQGGRADRGTDANLEFTVEQVYGGHGFHPDEVARSLDHPAHTVDASAASKRPNQADLRFFRDTGGQFGGSKTRDRADEPAPTIPSTPADAGHFQLEQPTELAAFRRDTGGRHQTQAHRDRADEPSPTVNATAKDAGHYEVEELRMVQPERPGFHKGREIDLTTDQAPTLAVGGFGGLGGERGYEIELVQGGWAGGKRTDLAREPAPTVTTSPGQLGAKPSEVEFDQQTVGNDAFEPKFGTLDDQHPTVTAEGARTSGELRSSATRVRRRFTIPELRRICGFPDDFVLPGSFSQQWERLGDAVPPPMAAAWARAIADGPLAAER